MKIVLVFFIAIIISPTATGSKSLEQEIIPSMENLSEEDLWQLRGINCWF